jgi:hypothetical protein
VASTNASLTGEFEVQLITNANEYTIISPAAATSTVHAAGTADAAYQINVGTAVGTSDYGWGVGTWGASTWGTPRPASTSVALDSRVWQFDNFGEDVVCQLVDGAIYLFDTSAGINVRATAIAGAPTKSTYAVVSTPDRHLVCLARSPRLVHHQHKTRCLCDSPIRRTSTVLLRVRRTRPADNGSRTATTSSLLTAPEVRF